MPSRKKKRLGKTPGRVFHFDALLMLLPLCVMAVYYYGTPALLRILACMAAGVKAALLYRAGEYCERLTLIALDGTPLCASKKSASREKGA